MSGLRRDQPSSFATSLEQVDQHRRASDRLLGDRLLAATYVNLDYRRDEVAAGHVGPRQITESAEWVEPTWRFSGCDSVDFGVELMTDSGVASLTWDLPGVREGLGLHPVSLVPTLLFEDAIAAVWDVSDCDQWAPVIGATIEQIELHYREWHSGGYWCPRISVDFGGTSVDFLLGEADTVSGGLKPSANNVAVVIPARALPSWAT